MAGNFSRLLALVGRSRTTAGVVVATLIAGAGPPAASAAPISSVVHQAAEEPSRRRGIERWLLSVLPRPQITPQAGHGSHSSHASHSSGTGHGSHYSGNHASHASHASHYSSESHSSHSSHYSGSTTPTPYPSPSGGSGWPSTSETLPPATAVPGDHSTTLRVKAWDRQSGRLVGYDSAGSVINVDILDSTTVFVGADMHAASDWRGPELHEFMMPVHIGASVVVGWSTSSGGVIQARILRLSASR